MAELHALPEFEGLDEVRDAIRLATTHGVQSEGRYWATQTARESLGGRHLDLPAHLPEVFPSQQTKLYLRLPLRAPPFRWTGRKLGEMPMRQEFASELQEKRGGGRPQKLLERSGELSGDIRRPYLMVLARDVRRVPRSTVF